jgi:hypothetical protein
MSCAIICPDMAIRVFRHVEAAEERNAARSDGQNVARSDGQNVARSDG